MAIGLRHWVLALMAALVVHASALAFFYPLPPAPIKSAGGSDIAISLGAAGGGAGLTTVEAENAVPEEVKATTPTELVTAKASESVRIETLVPAETRVESVVESIKLVELETRAKAVTEPPAEVVTTLAPEPARVEAPVYDEVQVETVVEPIKAMESETLAEVRPVTPTVTPSSPIAIIKTQSPEKVPATVKEQSIGAVVSMEAIADQASRKQYTRGSISTGAATKVSRGRGNKATTVDGDPAGAMANYYAQLQAWLVKYKRYPRNAKRRNQQGVVLLRFVVTREGTVTDFGIEKSSGYPSLDAEVRALIQRAQPLPKMPVGMLESRAGLLVPIQFVLR